MPRMDRQCMQRDGNAKKKLKGNARNEKTKKIKYASDGLISRWYTAVERISKFQDMSIKTRNAKRKKEKDGREYQITVG